MDNKFSVLMSVYKNDKPEYLKQAIDSISIEQSLKPDEIVLVVDGPVPESLNIMIQNLSKALSSLKVIPLKENVGLGKALNIGMEHVSNELVARMDSDDISLSDRFEKQLPFMIENKDIAVCGGQMSEFIDHPDNIVGYRYVPLTFDECRKYYRDRDPLNHVTVMMRKSAVMEAGNYLPWHLDEDTYLWGRILEKGFKIANINDVLVNVRVGKEMYARRGGWKYFKSDVGILKWKLNHGLTDKPRFLYNYIVRFSVQVLMPNRLRSFVFKKLLRKNS
ncbi:MAG: glycosyltransferase [Muribaculaceae bacterium]|nr:glycosyltransferase [Muribaculaceae bacterium]